MINTIIFDNNGVLVTSNEESAFLSIQKMIGLKIQTFIPIYNKLAEQVDTGEITTTDFFNKISQKFKINLSGEEIEKAVYGSFVRKEKSIDFLKEIKSRYQVALLTNFGDRFWELDKKWQVTKNFDPDKVFISFEIGMKKPDQEIFEYVLNKLQVKAEETIFIDDKVANIKAAQKIGINGICFTSVGEAKKQLKYILDKTNG